MRRAAVLAAFLALLLVSVLPLARTTAESFLVRDATDGHVVEVTGARYSELFVGPDEPPPAKPEDETPQNRPASKRWTFLGNSAAIALLAAVLAALFGVPYALLIARTDVPLRGLLSRLYGVPLVLPPLLVGLAWTYVPFLAPPPQESTPEPSVWDGPLAILRCGTAFAFCYFPLVVLFTSRAVRRVPAPLEDAARLAGGPWRALRSVTLPLVAPTILASSLFVFLFAIEDFALVDFLNWVRPVGQRVGVYPYESFTAWTKGHGEAIATALGMPLVVLGTGLLVLIHRMSVRNARTTIAGDFREAGDWKLGRWRWPAALGALALLAVSAGLPIAGLIWKSSHWSSSHGGLPAYRAVWRLVAGSESSTNELLWTLWFAGCAALLALPLAWVLAHHAARRGRAWPLVLAFLPLALPPVFLGAGSLRLYESEWLSLPMPGGPWNPFADPDSPRFGTILVLVAKYVPFATAALWAAFLAVDPKLEEAAATAGARALDRATGILAPLVRPALALSAVLVFVFCLREIDTIVLLPADTILKRIYTMVHFQRDEQVAALCVLLLVLEWLPFVFVRLLFPAHAAAERRARE
jgi:iron(III) transport system permease protein